MLPCLTDQQRKIRKKRPFVQDQRSIHSYSLSFFHYVNLLLDVVKMQIKHIPRFALMKKRTRFTFLRLVRILIPHVLIFGYAWAGELNTSTDAGKPNVIIFFLDDSGYGDYAHNGNPTIRTPNIAKLARDGMNFTQFYVTSPACSASRYSLLTGRYPGRSGLGSWVIGPGAKTYLHLKEITLAEGLKTRGYNTGIFGKWHLGNPNARNGYSPDSLPLAHGFDEWEGTNVSHDYYNAMLLESDPEGTQPIKGYSLIAKDLPSQPDICSTLTARSTESAISFIMKNKEASFFAYIHYCFLTKMISAIFEVLIKCPLKHVTAHIMKAP